MLARRIGSAFLVPVLGGLVLAAPGIASGASFVPLGDLPGSTVASEARGVSPDGSVVVGRGAGAAGLVWNSPTDLVLAGGLAGSSSLALLDASESGAVVVGFGWSLRGQEAVAWDPVVGTRALGDLAGGAFASRANGIDSNGTTIVGTATGHLGERAVVWAGGAGPEPLVGLDSDMYESGANDVSADGSKVAGNRYPLGGTSEDGTAVLWDRATSEAYVLGDLPGGGVYSVANAISADGSAVVGSSTSSFGEQAFLWTAADGMIGLGFMGTGRLTQAAATSVDGRVVVGAGWTTSVYSATALEAFVWTPDDGMQALAALLASSGVDLDGWHLTAATDVSSDGAVVVGYGQNPDGRTEAFLALIPEPSAALLVALGLMTLARVQRAH